METGGGKGKRLRNDLVLIGLSLLLAVSFLVYNLVTRETGGYAVVEVDGVETGRYPLSEDREIPVKTDAGTNLIVISGSEVYMAEADCPNRLCVLSGKIRYSGESIVCLPHKVIVYIAGTEEGLDAVA